MTVQLAKSGRGSVPIHATDSEQFAAHTAALEPAARRWLQTSGFNGAPDTFALLPAPDYPGGGQIISSPGDIAAARRLDVSGSLVQRQHQLDRRLAEHAYFADTLSIADFAIIGWAWRHPRHRIELAEFPHVQRWYQAMMARPGVARGFSVPLRRTP